jgi:PAP2 superfamily
MSMLTFFQSVSRATVLITALVVSFETAHAQPDAEAGKWQTWVLSSGSQFRLPPPPDDAATRIELERLRGMIASRDPAVRDRIAWWDSAAPAYRWNQIALDESLKAGLNANLASRRLALLHITLADAMVATWDSKYAHSRSRPIGIDRTLPTVVSTPATPSYPDEHAVAAAAAAAVLSEVFPQRAEEFSRLSEEAGRMRLLAGVAFPSDVEAGSELGRKIAQTTLERARKDRSDQQWTGSIPKEPGRWTGTNPVMPQAGAWVTWLLKSPDEFRPPAPPAYDSPEFAAEMAQVRAFQRTPRTNALAVFWEVAVGGLRNFEYWNLHTGRLLQEYGEANSVPRVARLRPTQRNLLRCWRRVLGREVRLLDNQAFPTRPRVSPGCSNAQPSQLSVRTRLLFDGFCASARPPVSPRCCRSPSARSRVRRLTYLGRHSLPDGYHIRAADRRACGWARD